jgi:membrane protein
LLSFVVSAVYRFAPDEHLTLRSLMPGALLAVVLWALASLGFAFLVPLFPDYGAVYGSFGAAISLLIYLYASALAILFGAEVNATRSAQP